MHVPCYSGTRSAAHRVEPSLVLSWTPSRQRAPGTGCYRVGILLHHCGCPLLLQLQRSFLVFRSDGRLLCRRDTIGNELTPRRLDAKQVVLHTVEICDYVIDLLLLRGFIEHFTALHAFDVLQHLFNLPADELLELISQMIQTITSFEAFLFFVPSQLLNLEAPLLILVGNEFLQRLHLRRNAAQEAVCIIEKRQSLALWLRPCARCCHR
mmetsp:Transcript_56580/g.151203  ORF Transcript_56580/g.151203 Transcript_56580/m.151203 type:complete len:210 (-) Transcript_56580:76-705(-)